MIYLDTSALVKLIVREQESTRLIEWLNNTKTDPTPTRSPRRIDCCTAQIGHIELMRATLRLRTSTDDPDSPARDAIITARRLLNTIDSLELTPEIAKLAKTIPPDYLRTLDTIHLATILANTTTITTVCAYDHRLIAACEGHDVPVVAPGVAPRR